MRRQFTSSASLLMLGIIGLVSAGCHTDMWVQPKIKAQHGSEMFADGMGSRPKVAGTVARGQNVDDPAYVSGYEMDRKLVAKIPADRAIRELKLADYAGLLRRGKERFQVFCSPCHGQLGDGKGMIASRGLKLRRPPGNYHTDRLRKIADGHIFDVMTHGYGVMYSFSSRITVADRWAIVSYVRALQTAYEPTAAQMNTNQAKENDGTR